MEFVVSTVCNWWRLQEVEVAVETDRFCNCLWMVAVNRMLLTSGDDCFLNDTVTAVVTSKG